MTDSNPSPSAERGTGSSTNPKTTGASDDDTTLWGAIRATILAIARLIGDAVVLGLGVVLLTLLFLSTGWPRWAFYALLLLGVACYVLVTPPWVRSA